MNTFLTIVHVLICLFLIGVVLLQSGRSGGMGVLSGAATQTVFGGRGAGSFLQKVTSVCAILFMLTSASLAWLSTSTRDRGLSRGTSGSSGGASGSGTQADAGRTASGATPGAGSTSGAAPSAPAGPAPSAPSAAAPSAPPSAPPSTPPSAPPSTPPTPPAGH